MFPFKAGNDCRLQWTQILLMVKGNHHGRVGETRWATEVERGPRRGGVREPGEGQPRPCRPVCAGGDRKAKRGASQKMVFSAAGNMSCASPQGRFLLPVLKATFHYGVANSHQPSCHLGESGSRRHQWRGYQRG